MYVHVLFLLDFIWTSFKSQYETLKMVIQICYCMCTFWEQIVQWFKQISMIKVIVIQIENIIWKINNNDDDDYDDDDNGNGDVKEK